MADLHLETRVALLEAQLEHARLERDATKDSVHVLLNCISTHSPTVGQSQKQDRLREQSYLGPSSAKEHNALTDSLARLVDGIASLTSNVALVISRNGGGGNCNIGSTSTPQQSQPFVNLLDDDTAESVATNASEHDASHTNVRPQAAERKQEGPSHHHRESVANGSLPNSYLRENQLHQQPPKLSMPAYRLIAPENLIEPTSSSRCNGFIDDVKWQPAGGLRHVYRTVLLTDLPANVTEADILQHVAGGILISLKVGMISKPDGKQAAAVEFFRQDCAEEYVAFRHANPLFLGCNEVAVEMIKTPTWPVPIPVVRRIEANRLSRCLIVYIFPRQVSDTKLRSALCQPGYLESHGLASIFEDEHGILHLSFKSIRAAEAALSRLALYPIFAGCRALFEPDPCNRPVSSLSEPRKPPTALPTQYRDTRDLTQFPQNLDYGEGEKTVPSSVAAYKTPSKSTPTSEPLMSNAPISEVTEESSVFELIEKESEGDEEAVSQQQAGQCDKSNVSEERGKKHQRRTEPPEAKFFDSSAQAWLVRRRPLISYADIDETRAFGVRNLAAGVQEILPMATDSDSDSEDTDGTITVGEGKADEGKLVELDL